MKNVTYFEHVYDNVKDVCRFPFNPIWVAADNFDYLALVCDSTIPLNAGEIGATVDPQGRRMLIQGCPAGNILVYENMPGAVADLFVVEATAEMRLLMGLTDHINGVEEFERLFTPQLMNRPGRLIQTIYDTMTHSMG